MAIVKNLLEAGAEVNMQNDDGFTPLFYAAQQGHLEVCNYLMQDGAADPSIAGSVSTGVYLGWTVFGYSRKTGDKSSGAATLTGGQEDAVEIIEMSAVDHVSTYPGLKALFASHEKCHRPSVLSTVHVKSISCSLTAARVLCIIIPGTVYRAISKYLAVRYWRFVISMDPIVHEDINMDDEDEDKEPVRFESKTMVVLDIPVRKGEYDTADQKYDIRTGVTYMNTSGGGVSISSSTLEEWIKAASNGSLWVSVAGVNGMLACGHGSAGIAVSSSPAPPAET